MPKFVISLLAMDRLETTRKCVESVLANSSDYWLILTDNGSKDGTAEWFAALEKQYAHITTVLNPTNELFIIPHCRAFEMARAKGCKLFVTLNDDTEVPPGWLEELAKPLDNLPMAAVSGPRGTFSELNRAMLGSSAGKLEYIEGSCMCVKIELVAKQGPLFSSYLEGIYFDDSDLCLRMQRAGYTIHRVGFVLKHVRNYAARAPEARERCRQCNARNQQTMLRKWSHWNKVRTFSFQIIVKRRFAIGDVLLTTPIIRALKKLWPLCQIDVETLSPDIFRGNPNVRRAAPTIGVMPNAMVIDLNGSYERTPQVHILESYAKSAGIYPLEDTYMELYPTLPPVDSMADGKWCSVHIGPTTWTGKNWPMERWVEVIDRMRDMGWKVLLLGDKGTPVTKMDMDKRGLKSIPELVSLLTNCRLHIGLDSFPAHAAAALGIPCVVLYGVSNPDMTKVHTAAYIAVRADKNHPDTGKRNKIPNITFLPVKDGVMRTIPVDHVMTAIHQITAS